MPIGLSMGAVRKYQAVVGTVAKEGRRAPTSLPVGSADAPRPSFNNCLFSFS